MAHNQYYPHGGNPQYYYYPQTNQNYYQQDPLAGGNNDDEEDSLNFNPLEWLFTFMHYWYLFVIALAIPAVLFHIRFNRQLKRLKYESKSI